MAYSFPEGSTFYFSPVASFGAPKTVTGISTASPAVATSVAHGYSDGNIVLLTSGWEDATDTLYEVDQLSADTFSLLGLDSTNTSWYDPTASAGTAKLVSTWTSIPQVLTISTAGGDPRFTTFTPLARRTAINVPTGFNATSITLTLGYDQANANYQAMLAVSRALTQVGFKMALSGGVTTYGFGYMAVSEVPALNVNQPNQVTAVFTLLGKAMSYD
jgi:Phage tail tube protein, TTP